MIKLKNPIPYTKEDIYLIVSMAIELDEQNSHFSKGYGGHKKFVDELIMMLTPEEREEDDWVKFYMKHIYKGGE